MATVHQSSTDYLNINNKHHKKAKMPVSSPFQQQVVVNHLLREAMTDERSKRWVQVVQNYRRLLRMLNKENLPQDFDPPNWFRMFLYECHYHLGLALQNIGEHKRAVAQYTRALEAIFVPKNGCTAGCHTNSCLMIPIHTRRAFACAKSGDLKAALIDAEKAVVLDCKNPDVYCIRALVRSTCREERMALHDVETALQHNPKHLCALILRGTLAQPPFEEADEWEYMTRSRLNEDHTNACSINPDCHNYLSVHDFDHPEIISFYDRFLYSLNVPHTISEVDLVSILPENSKHQSRVVSPPMTASSRPNSRRSQSCPSRGSQRPLSPNIRPPSPIPSRNIAEPDIYTTKLRVTSNPMKFIQETLWNQNGYQPFKCGMQQNYTKARQVLSRRKEYGLAVKEFVNRPRTAEDYLKHLEKERERKQREKERMNRPQTAMTVLSSGAHTVNKLDNMSESLRTNLTFDGSLKKTRTTQTVITTQPAASLRSKKIRAFEEVNVSDAPRMYYRPWQGDKLPVAEIEKKETISPPFKP